MTATSDPGSLPRNNKLREELNLTKLSKEDARDINSLPCGLKFGGLDVDSSICATCGNNRVYGTGHCGKCEHCIVDFDHHCRWLGTDIGLRNHFCFALLLVSQNVFGVVLSWSCLSIIFRRPTASLMMLAYTLLCWNRQFNTTEYNFRCINHNTLVKLDLRDRPGLGHLAAQEWFLPAITKVFESNKQLEKLINSKLFARLGRHPGWRRVYFGRFMPLLVDLDPDEAELIALQWAIALA